jgi:serine/threonine-protein kinase
MAPGRDSGVPTRIGRYWMFRPFARGGMASVHLGRLTGPAGFSRLVALKLLHPIYAADREHYTMLLDEARLSSRIRHPNVVQTLDVVHDDNLCIVMEYVHGVSLAAALRCAQQRGERMPLPIVSAVLGGVLQGLHAAHEARGEDGAPLGIVHRDISPQNVVIGTDGIARVLDFGVAKALRKDHVTTSGDVKGKVAYMAPEQLAGTAVTRQADIYGAGVVLWEAVVGARLFDETNEARLVARVLRERIPPPSARAPELDAAVDEVVVRAVAAERRARFKTAQEMAIALAVAIPPAPAEEVALWLERMAGDVLDERTEMVRQVESFRPEAAPTLDDGEIAASPVTAPSAGAPPVVDATGRDRCVDQSVASALARMRARRRSRLARGVVAAAAAAGIVAAATRLPATLGEGPRQPRPRPEAVALAAAAPGSEPRVEHAGQERPEPAAKARSRAGASVRPPRAKPGCDPPYSIDADGLKHYKASCLP